MNEDLVDLHWCDLLRSAIEERHRLAAASLENTVPMLRGIDRLIFFRNFWAVGPTLEKLEAKTRIDK